MAKPIGTLGVIDTFTIAGRVFSDLSSLIVCTAYFAGTGNSTLRKVGTTSGYQVTAGKTYQVRAATAIGTGTAAEDISFGYADNDIGLNSATALTNPVYPSGDSVVTGGKTFIYPISTQASALILLDIPATKYPFVVRTSNSDNGRVEIYGYEV